MQNILNKRVLVISNNCFSQSNSNGRTLGNLFYGWPKDKLAQFCVIAKDPNWELCDKYYCLEDKTVLRAFLHFKKAIGRCLRYIATNSVLEQQVDTKRAKVGSKTLFKVMLRELVWRHERWNSTCFQQWINNFDPEVLVLQVGDSLFMIDIAVSLAQSRQIPLFVYNTEGYYFFSKNWHKPSKFDSILFPYYKQKYHKKFNALMQLAIHSVYLNDKLQEDYDREFNSSSSVIYNSSDLESFVKDSFPIEKKPRISYLGNLGLDRDLALIEVGKVLHQINSNFHIDVYGAADDSIKERFDKAIGLQYHGMVSYDEVKKIIAQSDILFHVESEKGYKSRQLQYAFSGKIADSISSGKCFVLYGPKELACSKYIMETGAGWFAETQKELYEVIQNILYNADMRNEILSNAKKAAKCNHSFKGNAEKFQKLLSGIKF